MLKRIPLNIGKLFLPVSGGIFKFDQYCNWSVKFSVENSHSLVNKLILQYALSKRKYALF